MKLFHFKPNQAGPTQSAAATVSTVTGLPSTPATEKKSTDSDNLAFTNIDGIESYAFRTHPCAEDEYISREIQATGRWEAFETKIIHRLLTVFDLFIDLGANIGWYSALAQKVMAQNGVVHAFEPDPKNFALLLENTRARTAVRIFTAHAAVSDSVGEARLYHSASNLGDHQLYASQETRASIAVPVTTLAAYFGSRQLPPRLIKMDTQGSEPRIFRGAGKVISPEDLDSAYILEFWPHGMTNAGEDVPTFIDTLSQFPHIPFVIDQTANQLCRTTWDELRHRSETDLAPATMRFTDIVLVVLGTAAHLAISDLIADAE